jgi:hypothetical protein
MSVAVYEIEIRPASCTNTVCNILLIILPKDSPRNNVDTVYFCLCYNLSVPSGARKGDGNKKGNAFHFCGQNREKQLETEIIHSSVSSCFSRF